ncbi:MAG: DUF2155 domain-containing protein [Kiloniellales bacterium]|nr:DUF2155 domain-containing protein [Kiloniellales bacterium]
MLAAWGLALVLAVLPLGPARAETAVLQGLDKITARISTFEAPVNRTARFGSLEITVRRCHKTPPEEPPESAAFMEVVDKRPDSPSVLLFSGWMFASSPAVSALEHPVYDVWVIDCRAEQTAAEQPAGEQGSAEPAPRVLTLEELEAMEAQQEAEEGN